MRIWLSSRHIRRDSKRRSPKVFWGKRDYSFIEGDDAGGMYPSMTEGIRLSVQKRTRKSTNIAERNLIWLRHKHSKDSGFFTSGRPRTASCRGKNSGCVWTVRVWPSWNTCAGICGDSARQIRRRGRQITLSFRDNGKRKVGLRYDQTVPLPALSPNIPSFPNPLSAIKSSPSGARKIRRKAASANFCSAI